MQTAAHTKAFKYRIYPTAEQRIHLARVFGCCRYVYNRLLAEQQTNYSLHKTDPSRYPKPDTHAYAMIAKLPLWKRDEATQWLSDAPAQVLQQVAANAAEAYSRFFKKRSRYPRFKSKRDTTQSALYPNQSYVIQDDQLRLAKLDTSIKVVWHRPLPLDKVTQCCIKRLANGHYYVIFTAQYAPEKTTGGGFIGVDAGITDLATLSTGETLPNPRYYVRAQRLLARRQRQLSRKQKGSANRTKARLKVACLHAHIAAQRQDYLHVFTTRLIRENQAIGIESLNIQGMIRNRKLAKHIGDAGWGYMRQMLTYKAIASQHCRLILADPYFPSTHLCSTCGTKFPTKLGLKLREWTCGVCGTTHQRDENAAQNLEDLARSYHYRLQAEGKSELIILAKPYRQ